MPGPGSYDLNAEIGKGPKANFGLGKRAGSLFGLSIAPGPGQYNPPSNPFTHSPICFKGRH
jgi:hypothetical protein